MKAHICGTGFFSVLGDQTLLLCVSGETSSLRKERERRERVRKKCVSVCEKTVIMHDRRY